MVIAQIVNIAGLLFDCIGAVGIFKTKIIGLEKTPEEKTTRLNPRSNANLEKRIDEIKIEINENIEKANYINKENDKSSIIFFSLIFFGFILQVFASLINIFL